MTLEMKKISGCPDVERCPGEWTSLKLSDHHGVRNCYVCGKRVCLSRTPFEMVGAINSGNAALLFRRQSSSRNEKKYELALAVGECSRVGNDAEIWIKIDGSESATGWMQLTRSDDDFFRKDGSILMAAFSDIDLGKPQQCSVGLVSLKNHGTIELKSVELIDDGGSCFWTFNAWISSEDSTPCCRSEPS